MTDKPFKAGLWILSGFYILMIILMIVADVVYLSKEPLGKPGIISQQKGTVELNWLHGGDDSITVKSVHGSETYEINRQDVTKTVNGEVFTVSKKDSIIVEDGEEIRKGARLTLNELSGGDALYHILTSPEIHYSIILSLLSCTCAALLSLWVAIPCGYLMSRYDFPGKKLIDGILDIPIVLPPLVVGISLLALFRLPPFSYLSSWVVFEIPAIILAQFMVACAFAVRTLRVTFDRIPERFEKVAMTLGASRGKAFFTVVLPQAHFGIVTALTLAWARSLGEFGPILVFAGSTSFKTEVLPTSVFLELQSGSLKGTLVVSLIMIVISTVVLVCARMLGMRKEETI
jgi:molybdate transport system permease protein